MTKPTRLGIVALLYALMFFYAGASFYFLLAGIGSYDGWSASRDEQGLFVITTTDPQGPATLLQKGDVFVAINGITLKEDREIVNFNRRVKAGTPYRMAVRRGNQLIEFLFHTADFPPDRKGNAFASFMRMLMRLLFLGVGLGVFLLRRDSDQAWLMALLFGCMGGMLNESLAFQALGRDAEIIISAARIIGVMGLPLMVHFFLNFPTRLPWLQRHSWFSPILYLPALFVVMPGYGQHRLPIFLQSVWFDWPMTRWLNQYWFRGASHLTLAYLAAGLCCLAFNYRAASTGERRRARVAMLGSSLGIFNILLTVAFESYPPLRNYWPKYFEMTVAALPYTLPLVPLSFAYAIIRHKAIPISLIIRRGVRYLLVSRGAIIIESLIAIGLVWLVVRFFFSDWSFLTVIVSAALAILAWRLEDRLHRRFVAPAIDRRFFRQSYDAQRLIGELSDSLRTTTEVPRLLELVATKLQAALQTENVTILLKDRQSGEFKSAYACEYDVRTGGAMNCQRPSEMPANSHSLEALAKSDEPLELDWPAQPDTKPVWLNSGHGSNSFLKQELQVLQTLRPALLLPLKVKDELSGAVFLGARLGDLPFSSEDKRLVQSVVAPTSLALQNASLIEQRIEDARRREELEAENEARARELEEARQLQLSMLPKQVPQLPHLEIAAYMKTATEVGGDYYDFHLSSDGTLTVAIGDATGHGLKAGTVVTAMKSLFYTLALEPSLAEVLNHSSRVLKSMNLRSLFMALTLVKLEGNDLRIASAGMPPALLYRRATNEVEEILMKTMPLGSMKNYPYREQSIVLQSGDALVLMSDGFPERFNAAGEILGFAAGEQVLRAALDQTAAQIVAQFIQAEEGWAQGFAANDDVTFVVIKLK